MSKQFKEYKEFDLVDISKQILRCWDKDKTFKRSLDNRKGNPLFVFYEGPPSANGIPGIHHVMARTIKDIFCRYKTLKGFYVERKAGWDTHGLPVELGVEQKLNITKDDIGTDKISIIEYNDHCRKDVMKYTREWEDLTIKMGYWIDMSNPYVTYDNKYIETVWFLLKQLYDKKLLYKGYTIQPYSPMAGTGLSTHELNQPGCYRDVKDTSVVAQFMIIRNDKSEFLFSNVDTDIYFLAWTTTPWTLPSNTALAVGANIDYIKVRTFNQYTGLPITVILAKDLYKTYFSEKYKDLKIEDYIERDKKIPYKLINEFTGKELIGIRYEQLMPYMQPEDGDAFIVVSGDFVSTEEGTGIVHIAPSFGADDFKVAGENAIGSLTLVDDKGKFIEGTGELSGKYVKNEYDDKLSDNDETVDIYISVLLKKQNKAFKVEKYVHSYPHCWRTDKPILYYPLDSWFIRTTAYKDRMIELNKTINWKPESTGTGRFGKWLENLADWNLSRSRFWGTPLPIWMTKDKSEEKCIGSVAELKNEIEKSIQAGFIAENLLDSFIPGDNSENNYEKFDLHRPFVDNIILVSSKGEKMYREPDLIDVWFDSGAMPYAQLHYPFEEDSDFNTYFPADFIAEGVDQTRGWFFTLHAIATMISDSVSFKNIISNGLLLDKKGNKMSKRLGNAIDPFEIIQKYGPDPLRWYIITNAQPWDNLKFNTIGLEESTRKFFGTLFNTYSFFALYANIDNFIFNEKAIPIHERQEIDRWIISLLNTLIKEVEEAYNDYEPTKAARAIQHYVMEHLSNWYVRLNRKRFWGGEKGKDKEAAYQTLYTCLITIAKLASPIAPFYMDRIFMDLNTRTQKEISDSVHLIDFPICSEKDVDKELEEKMEIAQRYSSMILGLRRKVNIKVRQPLSKIMIPVVNKEFIEKFEAVKNLILSEVNVKEAEYISDNKGVFVKKVKPNYKILGPKYGKQMKNIAAFVDQLTQEDIYEFEKSGAIRFKMEAEEIELTSQDVEIISQDIPGWLVANEGSYTVALDIKITMELREEGIAREFVNRIQNFRKENGYNVTDRILIEIKKHDSINKAIENYRDYISAQTLANKIALVENLKFDDSKEVEIEDGIKTFLKISECK